MEWVTVSLAFVRNPFRAAVLGYVTTTSCQGAPEACHGHVSSRALRFAHELFSRDDAPSPAQRGRIPRSSVPGAMYNSFHLHGRFRQRQRRLFRRSCRLRVRPMTANNSKVCSVPLPLCCRTVTPNIVPLLGDIVPLLACPREF